MKIELSLVSPEGIELEEDVGAGVLELDPRVNLAEPAGPIHCKIRAWKQPGELFVRGAVRAPIRFQCASCGAFFSTIVEDSVFIRDYLTQEGQAHVDITEDIREAVLLALPANPRCRSDCRGLCPVCGADLNPGPCGCPAQPESGPWSALDALDPDGLRGERRSRSDT